MTLQQQADKLGISRQAVWQKTGKGLKYTREYYIKRYHKLHPKARYYKSK